MSERERMPWCVRIFFPDKTGDIADRAALALAVMGPDRALAEPGSLTLIETMSREHGQSSRVFKSAVIWGVAEDVGTLREEARKLLAWSDTRARAPSLRSARGTPRGSAPPWT